MAIDFSSWHHPDRGVLFVVTGASGTGKTTLVREALTVVPDLHFSVSAATRERRPGEKDGVDYNFVSQLRFDELLAEGSFLEWAEVYGNRYGTLQEPVEQALSEGRSILLEIDYQGARQVRASMPDAVFIFVLPPSLDAIEQRLRARSTDGEAVIARRVAEARTQLEHCGEFDYLVVNDRLGAAHDQFQAVIAAELLRRSRHETLVSRFAL